MALEILSKREKTMKMVCRWTGAGAFIVNHGEFSATYTTGAATIFSSPVNGADSASREGWTWVGPSIFPLVGVPFREGLAVLFALETVIFLRSCLQLFHQNGLLHRGDQIESAM